MMLKMTFINMYKKEKFNVIRNKHKFMEVSSSNQKRMRLQKRKDY